MIRSLDIRRGEQPLDGRRLAIHMAQATAPEATLLRPKPRWGILHAIGVLYVLPSGAALAVVAALWILRRGL